MAKFRVWVKVTDDCYIDVEAKDEDQARDMVATIDGGDFHSGNNFGVDWEITEVYPLEENDEEE